MGNDRHRGQNGPRPLFDPVNAQCRKRAARPQDATQPAEAFAPAGRRSFAPFAIRDHHPGL